MKIIQLLAAIDGESPGTIGSQIYGLGDDGAVYELVSPCQPREVKNRYGETSQFYLGHTGGWAVVCRSAERDEVIKHPSAP